MAALRADFEESFARILSEGIESGRWVVWLAEADGGVVSHAFVGRAPTIGPRAIDYLTNVYTRLEFRDRGIGGRVLAAVTAWARSSRTLSFSWFSQAR